MIVKDEGGRVQVRFDGEDGKIFSVRTAGIKRIELRESPGRVAGR